MATQILKYILQQSTANVDAIVTVPTLLTVDGKMGWEVTRVRAYLADVSGVVSTTDITMSIQLNTETGLQGFTDPDQICALGYLFQGTAGGTSAFQVNPIAEWFSEAGRITVQPNLYLLLHTIGAGAVVIAGVEIEYRTVTLTNLEVMRLLQGGA
jgi:hypothetical protein